ncbi:hypothetical protein A4X13_0g1445 [Tilletia indica]|uniref:Uncharacterized protein n=1 Tax=Tilletia indica TaxID=43049 RepID=A0A177TNH0_9BASI|nr:hypothetical protein A4X13_0g1445 [Tilletia indica]
MQRMAPFLATLVYMLLLSGSALEATAAPVATSLSSPSAIRRQQQQQQRQQRRNGVHRSRPVSLGSVHGVSRRRALQADDDSDIGSYSSGGGSNIDGRRSQMDMGLDDTDASGSGSSISGSSGSGRASPEMSHGGSIPKTFLYYTKSAPVQAEDRPVSRPHLLKQSNQTSAVSKTKTVAHVLQLVEVPIQESTGVGKLLNQFKTVPALQTLVKPHQFDDEDPPPEDPPAEDPPPPTPPPPPPAPARFDDGFYHPGYKTIAEAQAAAAAGIPPPFDDGLYHPGFKTWQEAAAAAHPPPPPPPADPPADDPPADERRRRSLQAHAQMSEIQRQRVDRRISRRMEVIVGQIEAN